jgi:hypothetical protein
MGGTCSAYGKGRDMYRVLVKNLRKGDPWGNPGEDGKIIFRWIFRK